MRKILLLCAILSSAVCDTVYKTVTIDQGPVRGALSEKGYYEFFGIPYATAPRGEHKFKAPLPPPSWNQVLDANRRVVCPQPAMPGMPPFTGTEEDCLVVNVFVPDTEKKHLPVLVYVHGGAYLIGTGHMLEHTALLKHDLIVVNINYRLHVRGFLCLGSETAPGNAGMKDQVAALRWVKKNIKRFGGNRNDITIAGFSAGSSSVEQLMLSPMAKGLFSKVIQESGSALSAWAIQPDPITSAKIYMKDISGKWAQSVKELEDFYTTLSDEKLVEHMYYSTTNTTFEFIPCVERPSQDEESFFTEAPIDILKRGAYKKVPIMSGFSREEGLFRIYEFEKWSAKMNQDFSDFLPSDLTFTSQDEKRDVTEKVKRFYFQENPVTFDNIKQYVDYFTDVIFAYSVIRSARIHAESLAPVYLYDFSYITKSPSPWPEIHKDKITGADHCAQSYLINPITIFGFKMEILDEDMLIQDRLAAMWANFVKYGKPIPEETTQLSASWPQLQPSKLNYLHIDLELEPREGLLAERVAFWDDIYDKYYRKPAAPGRSGCDDM